jgi:anti-sigma factor RsiW
MTCQELVELVTDYLEGALPDEDLARFEEHIAACRGCNAYVEQMRTTIAVTHASRDVVEPPAVAPLLEAFRDWPGLVRKGSSTDER